MTKLLKRWVALEGIDQARDTATGKFRKTHKPITEIYKGRYKGEYKEVLLHRDKYDAEDYAFEVFGGEKKALDVYITEEDDARFRGRCSLMNFHYLVDTRAERKMEFDNSNERVVTPPPRKPLRNIKIRKRVG